MMKRNISMELCEPQITKSGSFLRSYFQKSMCHRFSSKHGVEYKGDTDTTLPDEVDG